MSARRAWLAALVATALVVALDQALKQWAIGAVEPGAREQLLWFVDLVNVRNSGVAFGLFAGGGVLVAVVVTVALSALAVFFSRHATTPGVWPAVALLLGGALGNIIDRVRIGAVIDYIKVPNWPAFNLADSAITVGVVLLIFAIEREARRAQRADGDGS